MARALRPDQLPAALKKQIASAYYLHGTETLLKDDALAAILDRVLDPSVRDFNLDVVTAQQIDPEQLAGVASTVPMMAEHRVVVVRDIEAWKRKSKAKLAAAAYLERPSPETVVVLVQGDDKPADAAFTKHTVEVDCAAPVGEALEAWLDHQLAGVDVTLEPDARSHLLKATGGDLGLLAAECGKLAGLGGGAPLDRDTVGGLVGIRFGETVDDWRDAVLRDDLQTASAILPRVLEQSGVSGVRMAMILGGSLLMMQWARAEAERQRKKGRALANDVKSCCFEVRPMVGNYLSFAALAGEVVGRWSLPRLTRAVRAAHEADVALKSTTISDELGILTDLMLALIASRTKKAA
jgi:DNA polymerase-3 subunit delta